VRQDVITPSIPERGEGFLPAASGRSESFRAMLMARLSSKGLGAQHNAREAIAMRLHNWMEVQAGARGYRSAGMDIRCGDRAAAEKLILKSCAGAAELSSMFARGSQALPRRGAGM
jgi:hypothetical protein